MDNYLTARERTTLRRFVVCGSAEGGKSTLIGRLLSDAKTVFDDQFSVSGASTADAAIVVADVANGLLPQTRRHIYIVSLLGIRHTVLVVNKMDLLGYPEERFREIEADCHRFANRLGIPHV